MSARKIHNPEIFDALSVEPHIKQLDLPSRAVRICKNGIEFRTDSPIAAWTEMTVALETPGDSKKMHCNGVIVACNGNRETGYNVSMLFTDLSKSAEARLSSLS